MRQVNFHCWPEADIQQHRSISAFGGLADIPFVKGHFR